MKKHNLYIIILGALITFLSLQGCKDDENTPIDKDNKAPGQVFNTSIENLPGAALITYSLPSDDDLLYVIAEYTNNNGKVFDFRASYYTNNIKVEGFGAAGEYTVNLYTVDRSENRSAPVAIKVNPSDPQVQLTAGSLKVQPDFGGMSFTFENETKAELSFIVFTTDADGTETAAETFYTSSKSSKFAVRGYAAEPRLFGIVVQDKWENSSEGLYQTLTPIYETKLNKSLFRSIIFPNDAPATHWEGSLDYMWDDVVNDKTAHTGNDASTMPKHISFDMGVEAKLSRVNVKTVPDDKHWYNDVSPRFYEIWGSLDPDPSGSFDSWTKLVSIENIKPSGLSVGTLTEDDRSAGRNGDDADIPVEMPKVRYLRIVCTKNWSGNTNMCISEITLWGDDN
ncbi:DUF5000 domain-containing lipoprotein [Prevotella sp. 10(H)]|uniref:DUF5000 domain-containing lipoprotein n=1 Tax=Prevotella sp. 10(H) TaxID=1158294 RepID=UPI0004A7338B|nr:DUF5000 domain-containing lipoprotein [Prevotella sp. 10(H)]